MCRYLLVAIRRQAILLNLVISNMALRREVISNKGGISNMALLPSKTTRNRVAIPSMEISRKGILHLEILLPLPGIHNSKV